MAKKNEREAKIAIATHRVHLPPQLVDLRQQLALLLGLVRRPRQVEPGLVRGDDGQVGRDGEDVAHGPGLEEVERDVDVRLEQRLERHEPLLDLLRRVPLRVLFLLHVAGAGAGGGGLVGAGVGPALEELLHGVDGLAGFVVGDVDDVVEEELGDEAEELGKEDGGDGRRGPWRGWMELGAHRVERGLEW